jgi:DNA mismatch endonuclease, patch repair protein
MDHLTPGARSENMRNITARDTRPELAIRRCLYAAGFRYRLHLKELPGRPDIVLRRSKTAIYVNGCFWHGHCCQRGRLPKSNVPYWARKIGCNVRRDRRNAARLRGSGWRRVVVWECELKDPGKLERRLLRVLKPRGGRCMQ